MRPLIVPAVRVLAISFLVIAAAAVPTVQGNKLDSLQSKTECARLEAPDSVMCALDAYIFTPRSADGCDEMAYWVGTGEINYRGSTYWLTNYGSVTEAAEPIGLMDVQATIGWGCDVNPNNPTVLGGHATCQGTGPEVYWTRIGYTVVDGEARIWCTFGHLNPVLDRENSIPGYANWRFTAFLSLEPLDRASLSTFQCARDLDWGSSGAPGPIQANVTMTVLCGLPEDLP